MPNYSWRKSRLRVAAKCVSFAPRSRWGWTAPFRCLRFNMEQSSLDLSKLLGGFLLSFTWICQNWYSKMCFVCAKKQMRMDSPIQICLVQCGAGQFGNSKSFSNLLSSQVYHLRKVILLSMTVLIQLIQQSYFEHSDLEWDIGGQEIHGAVCEICIVNSNVQHVPRTFVSFAKYMCMETNILFEFVFRILT